MAEKALQLILKAKDQASPTIDKVNGRLSNLLSLKKGGGGIGDAAGIVKSLSKVAKAFAINKRCQGPL